MLFLYDADPPGFYWAVHRGYRDWELKFIYDLEDHGLDELLGEGNWEYVTPPDIIYTPDGRWKMALSVEIPTAWYSDTYLVIIEQQPTGELKYTRPLEHISGPDGANRKLQGSGGIVRDNFGSYFVLVGNSWIKEPDGDTERVLFKLAEDNWIEVSRVPDYYDKLTSDSTSTPYLYSVFCKELTPEANLTAAIAEIHTGGTISEHLYSGFLPAEVLRFEISNLEFDAEGLGYVSLRAEQPGSDITKYYRYLVEINQQDDIDVLIAHGGDRHVINSFSVMQNLIAYDMSIYKESLTSRIGLEYIRIEADRALTEQVAPPPEYFGEDVVEVGGGVAQLSQYKACAYFNNRFLNGAEHYYFAIRVDPRAE
jgi:hypothetical protein